MTNVYTQINTSAAFSALINGAAVTTAHDAKNDVLSALVQYMFDVAERAANHDVENTLQLIDALEIDSFSFHDDDIVWTIPNPPHYTESRTIWNDIAKSAQIIIADGAKCQTRNTFKTARNAVRMVPCIGSIWSDVQQSIIDSMYDVEQYAADVFGDMEITPSKILDSVADIEYCAGFDGATFNGMDYMEYTNTDAWRSYQTVSEHDYRTMSHMWHAIIRTTRDILKQK